MLVFYVLCLFSDVIIYSEKRGHKRGRIPDQNLNNTIVICTKCLHQIVKKNFKWLCLLGTGSAHPWGGPAAAAALGALTHSFTGLLAYTAHGAAWPASARAASLLSFSGSAPGFLSLPRSPSEALRRRRRDVLVLWFSRVSQQTGSKYIGKQDPKKVQVLKVEHLKVLIPEYLIRILILQRRKMDAKFLFKQWTWPIFTNTSHVQHLPFCKLTQFPICAFHTANWW